MAQVAIGLAVNFAANYLISQFSPGVPRSESGKVNDLRLTSSAYGAEIPQVYGLARVGGNVIWMTDLTESYSDSGGGGKSGGGGTRTYSYRVGLAIAVSRGVINRIVRIWGEDRLVYDVHNSPSGDSPVTVYTGAESQQADTYIQSYTGVSSTPAYRGIAYVVLPDFKLDKWNGRVPQFTFEVDAGGATVGSILADLFGQCGLSSADYDVSQATQPVTGFVVNRRQAARDAIVALLQVYSTDLVEVDGRLVAVPRGGAPVATLTTDDLAAREWRAGSADSGETIHVEARRRQDVEIPSRLDLKYFTTNRLYESASQGAVRPVKTSNAQGQTSIDTNLCLSDTEARQVAEKLLYDAWLSREPLKFSLSPRRIALAPADVVNLPVSGNLMRVRLTQVDLGMPGEVRCEALPDDPAILTQFTAGGAVFSPVAPVVGAGKTVFAAWSNTELYDADQSSAGFYVAAAGSGNWSGGAIYYSSDGGTTWVSAGRGVTGASVFGVTTAALADGTSRTVIDTADSLTVRLLFGSLTTVSSAMLQADGTVNRAVVGGEVLQFATATQNNALVYTLTNLLRGGRGSAMTGHVAGEEIALVGANVVRVPVAAALVGQTVLVKVVGAADTLAGQTAQSVVIAPRTLTAAETTANQAKDAAANNVTSLNGLNGAVVLSGTGGTTISKVGNTLTINSAPGGSSQWFTGSGVPAGTLGNNGDLYLDTSSAGIGDVYQKSGGAWTKVANIDGPAGGKGDAGAAGSLWFTGNGVPAASLGSNGDLYLNNLSGNVYQKSVGAWSGVTNIDGPKGEKGDTGNPPLASATTAGITLLSVAPASATTPVALGANDPVLSGIGNALKLQGRPVSATAPSAGQALVWSGADGTWEPGTVPTGGGTGSVTPVRGATPTQINSTAYSVPHPTILWVTVYQNGLRVAPSAYTVQSAGTGGFTVINFAVAPPSGAVLLVDYDY